MMSATLHQPLLTVAVICKNEAANIGRCLDSLLVATTYIETEIIVVDSCSTDATIEIARKYPVTIIQLGCDWPHSPAAGRFTAVNHARGKYLLLIDGDMELLTGFLEKVLIQLESDPDLVAIRGRLNNFHKIDDKFIYVNSKFATITALKECFTDTKMPLPIESASGSAVFRLEAVRKAGNFHPFLKAEEEYEFSQRLRARGGKIIYLPIDAVNHFGYHPNPLVEVGRRLRRGLVGGAGQVFQLARRDGYALNYLRRIRQHLLIGAFSLLSVPSLLLILVYPSVIITWLFSFFVLLGIYWWKMKDFKSALAAYLVKGVIGIDIIKGTFIRLPDKETYPQDVTIISKGLMQVRR